MDITVYLPDELGQRAKQEIDINLSRMLRDALIDEFQRRDTMATAEYTEQLIDLEDADGNDYKGRLQANVIAFDGRTDTTVYLADDGRVIVYDGLNLKHWESSDPEVDLRDVLSEPEYVEAMRALGMPAVVDI